MNGGGRVGNRKGGFDQALKQAFTQSIDDGNLADLSNVIDARGFGVEDAEVSLQQVVCPLGGDLAVFCGGFDI